MFTTVITTSIPSKLSVHIRPERFSRRVYCLLEGVASHQSESSVSAMFSCCLADCYSFGAFGFWGFDLCLPLNSFIYTPSYYGLEFSEKGVGIDLPVYAVRRRLAQIQVEPRLNETGVNNAHARGISIFGIP